MHGYTNRRESWHLALANARSKLRDRAQASKPLLGGGLVGGALCQPLALELDELVDQLCIAALPDPIRTRWAPRPCTCAPLRFSEWLKIAI